ncbi:MAG: inorganic phosphate transporter [Endomicrobia bacterium]|nr:inorganic phosphate transporter [Endomicrobiia bacterium]
MDYIWIVVIVLLCLIFSFVNGSNDAANVVAIPIILRTIPSWVVILLAGIFEFIGTYFLGTAVSNTISKNIVSPEIFLITLNTNIILVSTLFVSVGWIIFCNLVGMPVSASHTLVGSMLGGILAAVNLEYINLDIVIKIILVLLFTPVISFFLAYLIGKVFYIVLLNANRKIIKVFNFLEVISIIFFALSHGANNGRKLVGFLAFSMFCLGATANTNEIPNWIVLSCAIFLSLGVVFGAKNVIKTIAVKLCRIKHLVAVVSQLTSSFLAYVGALIGTPLSTTQLLVSAVIGAGMAQKVKTIKFKVSGGIFLLWLMNIPLTFTLTYILSKLVIFFYKFVI